MTEKEFITNEIFEIKKEGVKKFPDDYLNGIETLELEMPVKTLFMGKNFFDQHELITADGSPVFHIENIYKAKYMVYASLAPAKKIKMPAKENEIKFIVETYERFLDSLLKKINENYKKKFPGEQNKLSVSNEIFRKLNLVRI